jgi:hypothetical protein
MLEDEIDMATHSACAPSRARGVRLQRAIRRLLRVLYAAGLNQHSTAASAEYMLLRCALLFRSNQPAEAAAQTLDWLRSETVCPPPMRAAVSPAPRESGGRGGRARLYLREQRAPSDAAWSHAPPLARLWQGISYAEASDAVRLLTDHQAHGSALAAVNVLSERIAAREELASPCAAGNALSKEYSDLQELKCAKPHTRRAAARSTRRHADARGSSVHARAQAETAVDGSLLAWAHATLHERDNRPFGLSAGTSCSLSTCPTPPPPPTTSSIASTAIARAGCRSRS